jgi:hypothetical protein
MGTPGFFFVSDVGLKIADQVQRRLIRVLDERQYTKDCLNGIETGLSVPS